MNSLPPELIQKIWHAISLGTDTHGDSAKDIFEAFVALFIEENDHLREEILELGRQFKEAADCDDGDYGDIRAAAGCEFLCEHIVTEVIPHYTYESEDEDEDPDDAIYLFEDN